MAKSLCPPTTKLSNTIIAVSCIVGALLSAYAFHVEVAAEKDDNYEAMCDISEHVSCTKVFMSEYGKGFGIIGKLLGNDSPLNVPNGSIGIVFYMLISALCRSNNLSLARVQLFLSATSILISFYLAYILYFILYDFCVVCISTYFVNFINGLFSYLKVKQIQKDSSKKKKAH